MTQAARDTQEQVSFADEGMDAAVSADGRDLKTGGLFGDLKQNLTNQWKVRESATRRPD